MFLHLLAALAEWEARAISIPLGPKCGGTRLRDAYEANPRSFGGWTAADAKPAPRGRGSGSRDPVMTC